MRARTHRPWKAAGLAALVLLLPLGAPSGASAARVVSAKAVINACGGDSLAMTARAKPKKRVRGRGTRRRLRKFRRKVRGAKLEAQFRAIALFGGERRSPWVKADRGARASHSFSGLPSDSWTGFVKFRWRKGGRTRGSSFVNSSNGKVGGRRGRSLCSLGVGVPPRDTTPPFVTIHPSDAGWRVPFSARLFPKDEFSGVAATEYRVNGGALVRGPNIPLSSHGAHNVEYRAIDAAGNRSAFKRAVFRVDARAPSAPVVRTDMGSLRFNPSGNPAPGIVWNRSTDSGSGVDRYTVEALRGGSVAASRTVNSTGAARQSVTLPRLHNDASLKAYTIRVHAYDNVERKTTSASKTLNIDTRPAFGDSFGDAECAEYMQSATGGGTAGVFDCGARDIRPLNVVRDGCQDFLGCQGPGNTRTWTTTSIFQINVPASNPGRRFGVSLRRGVQMPASADFATGVVKIAGKTVLHFSGRSIPTGRQLGSAFSDALPAGNHTVELRFAISLIGSSGVRDVDIQPINPSFFVDDIFISAVD